MAEYGIRNKADATPKVCTGLLNVAGSNGVTMNMNELDRTE